MKIKNCKLSLNRFGKPIFQFEAIPKTSLEKDVLNAIIFENEVMKRKEVGKNTYALKANVQGPTKQYNAFLVYADWQIDKRGKR